MTKISVSELRQDLARYLDEAASAGAPIMIVGEGAAGDVVMMSKAEFAAWEETMYLLRSPRNAERLMQGLAQSAANDLIGREVAGA